MIATGQMNGLNKDNEIIKDMQAISFETGTTIDSERQNLAANLLGTTNYGKWMLTEKYANFGPGYD